MTSYRKATGLLVGLSLAISSALMTATPAAAIILDAGDGNDTIRVGKLWGGPQATSPSPVSPQPIPYPPMICYTVLGITLCID